MPRYADESSSAGDPSSADGSTTDGSTTDGADTSSSSAGESTTTDGSSTTGGSTTSEGSSDSSSTGGANGLDDDDIMRIHEAVDATLGNGFATGYSVAIWRDGEIIYAEGFGTKDEMKDWAAKRVADLKSRGFDKAGLYDPPGVQGTHVMYVLHHADKPQLYAGLPENPRISPIVEAWKGVGKYAGMALIGLTAAAGVIHHLLQGPNRVTREDEENAEKLAEGKS